MGNKKKERSKARKEEKKMIASQGELIKTSLEASSSLLLQGMEEQCTIGWNDHIVAAASNAGASEGGLKQEQDDLTLVYHSKDTLPSEWKEPLFDIFQANMEAQYHANWGWREMEKRLEIFSQESRHLIAVQHKKPVGFIHLRYVLDQDEEPPQAVLYIYEIQLMPSVQRRGLGGKMMEVVEGIAKKCQMNKMKLTVFKTNTSALNFYIDKLGYVIDPSSPSKWKRDECYEILSKKLSF